jgi:hypothetical protein
VVEADIASNAVTAGKLGADVQLGYRNVVINGAMQVHQRGTSTAGITTGGYYTADRYNLYINSLGTWTQSVENDAPTGSGFRKSLKMLCTTADASPSANDYIMVEQSIEGQNVQQFLKGTSSAKPFALSFWVKSNVTGTYIAELFDSDTAGARLVSASYTISASATWEKKTIIFPADTTGLFDNDTAASLTVEFWLGSGSAYASGTLNNAWAAANSSNRAVGQTNLASATSNYWQVTGVQLEAGAVATPFEFEQISTTLAKCQRYYEKTYDIGTAPGTATFNGMFTAGMTTNTANNLIVPVRFKVEKRTAPTMTAYRPSDGVAGSWGYSRSGATSSNTVTFDLLASTGCRSYFDAGAAWVPAVPECHWVASAEL